MVIEYRDEWANGRESRYQTAAELRARLSAGLVQLNQRRQAEDFWLGLFLYGRKARARDIPVFVVGTDAA